MDIINGETRIMTTGIFHLLHCIPPVSNFFLSICAYYVMEIKTIKKMLTINEFGIFAMVQNKTFLRIKYLR